MESRAPAVVAVVVTTGPGPGLEATLASLVDQDYPEMSLLVVANDETDHVSSRVAAVAPHAFVRVLEENRGFGAACNEAALMVEGTAFFLFCHDDVRLDSDAVHLMVEAAFRANAGVVSPKVVAYEDPLVLLHVGQTCDRFGVVQERIQTGEIDHGQQDLERDVFVAPGGVTLVRADLFATLRGFDPMITALGEDVDLCWRAQVAGARVIVAPAARVAHRETIATGERPVTAVGTRRASRQDLQRRHQLLVVATGWGVRYSLTTLASLMVMDAMEFVVALVGRDTDRAGAIVGSWRWLLTHRRRIRERRRLRAQLHSLSDGDLHRLQVGGAHRLKRFLYLLVREGLDRARGILPEAEPEAEPDTALDDDVDAGVGFGAAFAESEEFDEIPEGDGLSRRRSARFLTSFRSQALVILCVAVAVAHRWAQPRRDAPAADRPPRALDSWWTTWRHFFASWSPNGVGSGQPGMPGYGVLAFAGTFVFGRMGILPRVALLGAAPLGAIGVARLLKGRVSNRARVVASVAYLAMPVGLNMIAQGRLDVLAAVTGLPFIVRRVFELLRRPGVPHDALQPQGSLRAARLARDGDRSAHRRRPAHRPGERDGAGDPGGGGADRRGRVARAADGARRRGALRPSPATFRLPPGRHRGAAGAPDGGRRARGPQRARGLRRRARALVDPELRPARARRPTGPSAPGGGGTCCPPRPCARSSICRGDRRRIATKVATIAALTLVLVALVARHWTGAFTPDLDVLLALYVTCLAVMIGLGVSAVELDLRRVGFGWRQLLAAAVVAALVVAALPFLADLSSGRFDLPTTSVAESLSALAPSDVGGYRVLWLGDPTVTPIAGWSVAPGLAAATSSDGLPGGADLFATPGAGAAVALLRDVRLALQGGTVRLGQLLAPAGVSSIVVMNTAAPEVAGVQKVPRRTAPTNLVEALNRQVDLSLVLQTRWVEVFANSMFHGVVAQSTSSGGLTPVLGAARARPGRSPRARTSSRAWPRRARSGSRSNGLPAPRAASTSWAGVVSGRRDDGASPPAWSSSTASPGTGCLAALTLLAWLYAATGLRGTAHRPVSCTRRPAVAT